MFKMQLEALKCFNISRTYTYTPYMMIYAMKSFINVRVDNLAGWGLNYYMDAVVCGFYLQKFVY